MTRGRAAQPGDTNVSANGYHYTRTDVAWRLTHHLVAEEKLGRALRSDERVTFADGDRTNLHRDNIVVRAKGSTSTKTKRARIEARIAELQAQLEELDDED